MTKKQESKREFLKKSAYVVPTILTLKAIPAFAGSGTKPPKRSGWMTRGLRLTIQLPQCCRADEFRECDLACLTFSVD